MNFIDKGAFSFFLLIPVIILFYLLKLRRKPLILSNTFLWRQAVRDSKADTPFQRLRHNILLIIQILALIFLISVKARPYLKTTFQGEGHCVLILDNSASMQARDTGNNRFSEAQKGALKLIEQMHITDQMMVISVNSRPRIESAFTHDRGNLCKIIKSIKPSDCSTDMRDALILAISSLKNYQDGKIFLLTDGSFPDVGDLGPAIPPVVFLPFGKRCNNIGITNVNLRRTPFSSELELLVEVENFSPENKDFPLELYVDNRLVDVHKIIIEAGKSRWEVFQGLTEQKGTITVKADIKDDLDLDNTVYAVISPVRPMKILLVSDGNPFLENLLKFIPGIEIFQIHKDAYSSAGSYDLVIFDGGELTKIDKGNFVFFGTNIKTDSFKINGEIERPFLISWDKEHPVMRFVDLSDVHIAKAFSITPPVTGKILVEAKETPLICNIVEENFRAIFIGFTIYNSDLILRPAFPIFFSNIIQYFNPSSQELSGDLIKTGYPVKISNNSGKIKVITPDGRELALEGKEQKDIIFADTSVNGIYTIRQGKEEKYIGANLTDNRESDIKPVNKFLIGSRSITSTRIELIVQKELWKYLALVVLVLLTLEWYIFHRKVT